MLETTILKPSIPVLDDPITYEELINSLAKCKNGKAPGMDGVDYAFFKSLPQNWILYMNHFFNKILATENVPNDWGNLITFMLLKRGGFF